MIPKMANLFVIECLECFEVKDVFDVVNGGVGAALFFPLDQEPEPSRTCSSL